MISVMIRSRSVDAGPAKTAGVPKRPNLAEASRFAPLTHHVELRKHINSGSDTGSGALPANYHKPPPQNSWVTEGPIFLQVTVIEEVAITAGCSRFDARFALATKALRIRVAAAGHSQASSHRHWINSAVTRSRRGLSCGL